MRRPDGPGYYIIRYTACWWINVGKYVIRVGKPWGHPYRFAWRPVLSVFRCWK